MCRMFGYCGKSEADVHELHSGLTRACANDPSLTAVAPSCSQHSHGWGYVIHADNGLFHYRTARSIYDDKISLPKLEGNIRAIFHGRYASDQKLSGPIFAHPFLIANDSKVTFMAHNGGVEPDSIPPRKVDSEWALEQLTHNSDTSSALVKLKSCTKSALNLLILTVGRESGTPATLSYFHYFKPTEPDRAKYYQMYEGTMPGGRAVVSSTLSEHSKVRGLSGIKKAEFETLIEL